MSGLFCQRIKNHRSEIITYLKPGGIKPIDSVLVLDEVLLGIATDNVLQL